MTLIVYEVFEIEWETDGEEVSLPTSGMVHAVDEEDAINRISQRYGWFIKGAYVEQVE
jgi:hypothetical protein